MPPIRFFALLSLVIALAGVTILGVSRWGGEVGLAALLIVALGLKFLLGRDR